MNNSQLSTMTRRVVFAPLDDHGRADIVAQRIRTAVTIGVLAEGEVLPPISELSTQLNISPVTLRDALTQLRTEGLVVTTRGRGGGTAIARQGIDQVKAARAEVQRLSTIDLRDLADWRRAVVCESASLAARRFSDEDLALLAQGGIRLAAARDPLEARRADSRFFIELAATAQSVKLSSNMITLQVEYVPVLTVAYEEPDVRTEVAGHLQSVMLAVRDGDAETARASAQRAVDRVASHTSNQRVKGFLS